MTHEGQRERGGQSVLRLTQRVKRYVHTIKDCVFFSQKTILKNLILLAGINLKEPVYKHYLGLEK